MGLDHLASNNGLQKEQLIRDILDGVSGDAKKLEGNIKEKVDETTLVNAIENNFKKGGNWIEYSKMKNSGYHGFLTQASIDLLSNKLNDCKFNEQGIVDENGKTLDQLLKDAGGVDNLYYGKTTKLVKIVQKILGYQGNQVDGYAGQHFFEDMISLLKNSDSLYALQVIREKNMKNWRELLPHGKEFLGTVTDTFFLGEHVSKEDIRAIQRTKIPGLTTLESGIMKQLISVKDKNVTDFYVRFGAGTDGTDVKPGKITKKDFETKRSEIVTLLSKSNIRNKIPLMTLMGSIFGEEQTTFKNNWLLAMRNLEAIKGTITAYNNTISDKIEREKRPNLHFVYDPVMNVSGDVKDEGSQRFLKVDLTYNTKES